MSQCTHLKTLYETLLQKQGAFKREFENAKESGDFTETQILKQETQNIQKEIENAFDKEAEEILNEAFRIKEENEDEWKSFLDNSKDKECLESIQSAYKEASLSYPRCIAKRIRKNLFTRQEWVHTPATSDWKDQFILQARSRHILKDTFRTTPESLSFAGEERDYLGIGLLENMSLTIEGNAGDGTGDSMSGRMLTVEGDAGKWTGDSMSGGTLIVEGKAGNWTGCSMSGGILVVEGDAEYHTGNSMSGGTLIVEGDAEYHTGNSMSGGILDLRGAVTSFHASAFTPTNEGIIRLAGEVIWENKAKTEAFEKLKSQGKITIES